MKMDGMFSKEAFVHSRLLETQMSMMCLPPLDLDTPGSYL